MKINVKSNGHDLTFTGRTAWALREFVKAGGQACGLPTMRGDSIASRVPTNVADGGNLVGRDPRELSVEELRRVLKRRSI